jgi:hypothetical protein
MINSQFSMARKNSPKRRTFSPIRERELTLYVELQASTICSEFSKTALNSPKTVKSMYISILCIRL